MGAHHLVKSQVACSHSLFKPKWKLILTFSQNNGFKCKKTTLVKYKTKKKKKKKRKRKEENKIKVINSNLKIIIITWVRGKFWRFEMQAMINSFLNPTQSPLKTHHSNMHTPYINLSNPCTSTKQYVIICMGSINIGTFILLSHIVKVIESLDIDPMWNITEPIFLHVRFHP